jgi:chaperonin GroES
MIHMQLLNNKVLVQHIEASSTTESGFILPTDTKEEKIRKGEIVAVGNGVRNEKGERVALDVSVGQIVMYEYSSYSSHEIEIEKKKYLLINESDIIGIVTK